MTRLLALLAALVFALPIAVLRGASEAELIATLQSNAGPVEKSEAARDLRLTGTAQAVPALAGFLTDEGVGHAARYALEGMALPAADAALREALARASGLLKLGLVDSLGWRRDRAAVPQLVALLSDADPTHASAAAVALGRIGGDAALKALLPARASDSPAVREAAREGLLSCADQLLADGERVTARRIYQSLTARTEPYATRVAAHRGLLRAAETDVAGLLRAALTSEDPAAQTAAVAWAADARDPASLRVLVGTMAGAKPELRIALLTLLAERDEPAALPAVLEATRSDDVAVRAAAWTTVGVLGDAATVSALASAATSRDAGEQQAARQALTVLRRGEVAAALVAMLAGAPPAMQVEVVRALSARADQAALPELLRLASSENPATRRAALQALGRLARGDDLEGLAQLLADAPDAAARTEVRGVFEVLVERAGELGAVDAAPIARRASAGDLDTRIAFLQVSALFADERLRAVLREARADSDPRVREAAARALCAARDPLLLPDALELARASEDAGLRSLAIEGVVRLATDEHSPLPAEQRAGALRISYEIASGPEDKRRVLSGLARVPRADTLRLASEATADAAVRPEAELATLQIARALGAAEFERVMAALRPLAASAASESVRTAATALLKQLDSGWLYAGPYRRAGLECQALFDVPFPPEQPDAGAIEWQRAPGGSDPGRRGEVELGGVVGGHHCVVYLKTRVYSPVAQEVVFSLGSDDGIKFWVNGALVHANNAVRGLTPDQDKAPGHLREGWNDLLAKITQHTVGCGMTMRITDATGHDLPGLLLDPRGGTL